MPEDSWKEWYGKKKDSLNYGAVALVVAAVGVFLTVKYRSDRREEAQELFSQAQNGLRRAPQGAAAATGQNEAAQQLSRIGTEFGDLPLGRPAALYEAELLREKGQLPQALDKVRAFLDKEKGKKDIWQALGRRNEAYYLELSGSWARAGQSYMALKEEKYPWIAKEELDLGQARCLLAQGRKPEAQALLKPIAESKPSSYWTRSAEALLNF